MYDGDLELTMCELVDEDTNNKRRRNKGHLILSIMLNSWHHHPGTGYNGMDLPTTRQSPVRRLCLLTTIAAFILGILVGITIPVYLLPKTGTNLTKLPLISVRNESVPERIPIKSLELKNRDLVIKFPSVSFVSKSNLVMPQLLRQKLYGEVNENVNVIVDSSSDSKNKYTSGVYWSEDVEGYLPKGFEGNDSLSWRSFARRTPVVKVEEGCGRMQNRMLTFEDGTKSCCRYRQNTDQIQGELFSYYLGTVLKLRNLAPSSLALVKLSSPLFNRVKPQLNLAQWSEDRAVVLTKFVNKLEPANIPVGLRTAARRLHPPDTENKSKEELIELIQWSDLIIFDYLTANLDRVVNNLYNLQWNSAMMDSPAHNLAKDPTTGLLIFFDNESGLLHGYRLLEKYEHYHIALLDALCVFRETTSKVIKRLHKERNIGDLLQNLFKEFDPEFKEVLPTLPDKSVKILNERLDRVYDQITMCERQYPKMK